MATLSEIPVISAPFQRLETVLAGVPVAIALAYNTFTNRWSFDLVINGVETLTGRRLVTGVDLLKAFNLGVGKLAVVDWEQTGGEPGRTELPAGQFRLMHLDEAA